MESSVSRIVRIPILPLKIVNAHLIRGNSGCVLVDAGLPGSAVRVERVLLKLGLTFEDVKAIVITHAHVDHAGGASELREKTRAPILAHEADLPYYKREKPMNFCPTGKVGRYFLRTPLPHQSYKAFEPDILLAGGDTLDISRFGVAGVIRHTPGHTAGSLSVTLANDEAMVGDLVASGILIGGIVRIHHAIQPPFEEDTQATARELLRLVGGGVKRFHLGHGGPLDAIEVRRHAERLVAPIQGTRKNQEEGRPDHESLHR
ncbi:MBL fold metallo-hydrolase [Granulicella aggregans]|jgi:glyoxylase-like metal-dependent hydrolase (beta-lactamase superfamily II)|uniref:MBL fold metallo-hydrolase n=1 Tax=Granulicella aggregans TaxID=474949 RepID=UPI0021E0ABFA|nr:MBL fold metallo-hydrolase [Granulicella aggregans]